MTAPRDLRNQILAALVEWARLSSEADDSGILASEDPSNLGCDGWVSDQFGHGFVKIDCTVDLAKVAEFLANRVASMQVAVDDEDELERNSESAITPKFFPLVLTED